MKENERLTINGKEVILYREVETNLYRFSKEAVDMLLEALEEREQYRAIGTVEQLRTMFDGYWKLKDLCEEYEKYGLPEDYWKLNEICKEYSAIGTIEEFKALKEKKPKKKKSNKVIFSHDSYPHCPHCGRSITGAFMNPRLCPKCHGELDWH